MIHRKRLWWESLCSIVEGDWIDRLCLHKISKKDVNFRWQQNRNSVHIFRHQLKSETQRTRTQTAVSHTGNENKPVEVVDAGILVALRQPEIQKRMETTETENSNWEKISSKIEFKTQFKVLIRYPGLWRRGLSPLIVVELPPGMSKGIDGGPLDHG